MVPEWGAAFNSSNTTIRALREFAPSTHDRDTQATVPICLSYHLRGSCYESVNGHQRTGLCLQPSAGPCPHSLPNAWAPLVGVVTPLAPSRQLVAPPPPRAADGRAKCCNRVALAGRPQLQTYPSLPLTHTGRCPGPWS